jgi:hypothetical protein
MTTITAIHFEADTVLVEDEPRYRLYAACTEKGSLRDTNIFLHEIVDPNAPLRDVFTRVLQVTDLDLDIGYKSNRLQALSAGSAYWRAAQMVKYFEEVDVAVQAKQVLRDEINRLIADYTAYTTQYETSGDDVAFPTGETSLVAQYTGAYDSAYTNFTTSLTTYTTTLAAEEIAEAEYKEVDAWLDLKGALDTDLGAISSPLGTYVTAVNTFVGTSGVPSDSAWFITKVGEFIAAYDASGYHGLDTQRNTLNDAKAAFNTARNTFYNTHHQEGIDCASDLSSLNVDNYYSVNASDLERTSAAFQAATTARIAAAAAVYANYNAMESAYEAAKEVCPSWIPDEPLPPRPSI